jgi:hypothetical protein
VFWSWSMRWWRGGTGSSVPSFGDGCDTGSPCGSLRMRTWPGRLATVFVFPLWLVWPRGNRWREGIVVFPVRSSGRSWRRYKNFLVLFDRSLLVWVFGGVVEAILTLFWCCRERISCFSINYIDIFA